MINTVIREIKDMIHRLLIFYEITHRSSQNLSEQKRLRSAAPGQGSQGAGKASVPSAAFRMKPRRAHQEYLG